MRAVAFDNRERERIRPERIHAARPSGASGWSEFLRPPAKTLLAALHLAAGVIIAAVAVEVRPEGIGTAAPWILALAFAGLGQANGGAGLRNHRVRPAGSGSFGARPVSLEGRARPIKDASDGQHALDVGDAVELLEIHDELLGHDLQRARGVIGADEPATDRDDALTDREGVDAFGARAPNRLLEISRSRSTDRPAFVTATATAPPNRAARPLGLRPFARRRAG